MRMVLPGEIDSLFSIEHATIEHDATAGMKMLTAKSIKYGPWSTIWDG